VALVLERTAVKLNARDDEEQQVEAKHDRRVDQHQNRSEDRLQHKPHRLVPRLAAINALRAGQHPPSRVVHASSRLESARGAVCA
jgi:hypothetical protein